MIEVPGISLAEAFAKAKASDTVQVRGRAIGAGFRVPPYMTLRGCTGAAIHGNIGFEGNAGVIEGFLVEEAGTIVANQTGSYVVHHNRFVNTTANAPG